MLWAGQFKDTNNLISSVIRQLQRKCGRQKIGFRKWNQKFTFLESISGRRFPNISKKEKIVKMGYGPPTAACKVIKNNITNVDFVLSTVYSTLLVSFVYWRNSMVRTMLEFSFVKFDIFQLKKFIFIGSHLLFAGTKTTGHAWFCTGANTDPAWF